MYIYIFIRVSEFMCVCVYVCVCSVCGREVFNKHIGFVFFHIENIYIIKYMYHISISAPSKLNPVVLLDEDGKWNMNIK